MVCIHICDRLALSALLAKVLSDCPKSTLKLFGTLHVSLSMQD